MRIALDYYRILGIPIQVTDEQLNQAYCDRGLQLPRREYSERAIASRKYLLDKAYNALENAEKRAQYELELKREDEREATETEPSDSESPQKETEPSQKSVVEPFVPTIEIYSEEFIGSLLILQDLGEYEQIINLGVSYLNKPETELESDKKTFQAIRKDLVLLIALAYWELCREQWQDKAYETAAALGTKGLELLEKENLFPGVRAEIRAELYKLRPYRILELLTHGSDNKSNQHKGLQLLKEMLQERRGIDGKGDDRSGLSVDRFLLFIQQIRVYLTVKEQQELFEVEAQRPSAVGKYLAVYALIAKGFADKQPMLIVQANELLRQLSERQDVRLEQAISALLLGQTESATRLLESCQEEEPLAFIRAQSQGEPDLLRGLCIYGERWLQTEVFSHFRDLAKRKASIKEYFDDKDVQTCLMQLPLDKPLEQQPSALDSHTHTGDTMANNRTGRQQNLQQRRSTSNREYSPAMRSQDERFAQPSAVGESRTNYYGEARALPQTSGRTATLLATQPSTYERKTARFKNYPDELPEVAREKVVVEGYRKPTALEPSPRRRRSRSSLQTSYAPTELPNAPQRSPRRRTRSRGNYTKQRLLALAAVAGVGALAIGAAGWMISKWSQNSQSPLAALEGEQLSISLSRPPLTIPTADAQEIPSAGGVLSQQEAEEVIKTWLDTKSQAFGQQHQIEKLDGILTGAILSTWRDRTKSLQSSNDYWRYEHQMQVRSLKTDTQNPDRATVEASVKEVANYYSKGQLNSARSYNENLIVRYELVRQQDNWLIQNIKVVK